jgi:hypothetical protein
LTTRDAVQRIIKTAYPNFPCELCLVASPNIPSNSVARSPSAKLKMSIETYFPDLVFPVSFLHKQWNKADIPAALLLSKEMGIS